MQHPSCYSLWQFRQHYCCHKLVRTYVLRWTAPREPCKCISLGSINTKTVELSTQLGHAALCARRTDTPATASLQLLSGITKAAAATAAGVRRSWQLSRPAAAALATEQVQYQADMILHPALSDSILQLATAIEAGGKHAASSTVEVKVTAGLDAFQIQLGPQQLLPA